MSPELRASLELLLNAITALGTLAAVWVALYLARSDRRETLKARASSRVMVSPGERLKDGNECVLLSITNLTHRPVTLTGIGWHIGYIRPQSFIQMPSENPWTSKLPVKLEYGESANYVFLQKDFFREFSKIARHVDTILPWLTRRYLRFVVSTSGSESNFSFMIDENLADLFISEAKKLKAQKKKK